MNHIINNVYLGCFESAENKELLMKNNIKYIFNVAVECNNSGGIKNMDIFIHKYKIYDDYDITLNILEDIYSNMSKIDTSDGNILVHCAHGRSRSVCIVLYYLMKNYGYSIDNSLELIKKARPIVHPSPNYLKLLSDVDNSFDIDNYYLSYLTSNFDIKISSFELLKLIKLNVYDLNKIVNQIYL